MLKTQNTLFKFSENNIRHSKSMNNFILLNKKRQMQQNYQWKPLKTKQQILQRTTSLNREISFGGSYSHKKSILLTLNKQFQSSGTKSIDSTKYANQQPKIVSQGSLKRFSQTSIDTESFLRSKLSLRVKQQISETQNKTANSFFCLNKQRMESKLNMFINTTANFNQAVQKNIDRFKHKKGKQSRQSKLLKAQRPNILNVETLRQKIQKGYDKNQRIIAIVSAKRYGLRIRIKHTFASVCMCTKSLHQSHHRFDKSEGIKDLSRDLLSIHKSDTKNVYFFDLDKNPIASSNDLPISTSVIIVSMSPVFYVDNQLHFSLYEEAGKIQKQIEKIQTHLKIDFEGVTSRQNQRKRIYVSPLKAKVNDEQNSDEQQHNESTKYDWQLIDDVDSYVQKIVENPQSMKTILPSKESSQNTTKNQIRTFYSEKFDQQTRGQTGQNFRNPLLEDHSHYHSELKHKHILSAISQKLQQEPWINNKHILKREPIETLIAKDKQQKEQKKYQAEHPDIIKRNVSDLHKTKKAVILQLDQKNPLLVEQNIPYMMDKYGISRYEIHNLFTIYKTLQKISAMKFHATSNPKKVLDKGIDRSTFDEGMKRLDINPGDEVIKNICYFDDFISWEQFIKIVSIGLRKTPQEKLQAILTGIGGASNGHLTKNQVSIMIGNSLNKIFDSEQTQLKEYFTEVAMKDLDSDGSGTVQVEQIKRKCFHVQKTHSQNGQSLDLVSFLLLNS